jgi:predicted peroxiredoxin
MDDDKILIIMTSGVDTPRRCATPFFFAHLAAVMDYDVTMFFTIDGIQLLETGVAETVFPKEGGKAVSEFRDDALEAGVKFTACTAATELHDLDPADLIDGVEMVGGATMWQYADESKTVLTF